MKILAVLLALAGLAFADLASANAIVTSAAGTVQVQMPGAAPRTLRQGDEVVRGATVTTGPASTVVLRFNDGQIAALTANSRMTVSQYDYDAGTQRGSILLSLVQGGMRAITGLIGRNSPERVSYRAATATIGIRGTDVTIITNEGHVMVSVTDGAVSFTFRSETVVIRAGEAIHARPDGTFSRGAIAQIQAELMKTPLGQALLNALGGLSGLTDAVNQARGGTPGRPPFVPADEVPPGPPSTTPGPGGPPGGGAGGGGPASRS